MPRSKPLLVAATGTSSVLAVLLAVTFLAATAPLGVWAVPANDNCTDAYDMGTLTSASDVTYYNDWSGATWEGHEGCGSSMVSEDMWHTIVAGETGLIRADLCASDGCWGLMVSVYDFDVGSCASLTSAGLGVVDCGISYGCQDCDGKVTFNAVAGKTYMIRVWYPYGGPSSPEQYGLRVRYIVPPANDDCVNHIPIDTSATFPVSNDLATGEHEFCNYQNDYTDPDTWYSFSVPAGAYVTLTLCDNSDYDPALTMWPSPPDEVCGDPVNSEFVCNDDYCDLDSGFDFICEEEVYPCNYTLRVAGYYGNEGSTAVDFDIKTPNRASFQPSGGSGVWSDASAYDINAVPAVDDFLTLMPDTTLALDVDATIGFMQLLDGATLHIPAGRTLTITTMLVHPSGERPRCFIVIEGTLIMADNVILATTCDVIVRDGTWQFTDSGYPRLPGLDVGELHVNWPGALIFEGNGMSTVAVSTGTLYLHTAAMSWTEGSMYFQGYLYTYGYQRLTYPREEMPPEPSYLRRSNITRAPGDVSVRTWSSSSTYHVRLSLYGNATALIDWNGVLSFPSTSTCVYLNTYAGTLTIASGTTIECLAGTSSSISMYSYSIGAYPDFPYNGIYLEEGSVIDVSRIYASNGAITGDGLVKYTTTSTYLSTRAGLSPGRPGSSQRHLIINGRTDKHWGTYRFHLGGTEPGVSNSLVEFADDMSIDGKTVTVTIDPGYLPDEGQEFTVMRTNGTFTGALDTSINGTLKSECANVVPVYPTGQFKELKVRVEAVFCCGITTCGQCTQRDDCAWCPDSGSDGGTCYDASDLEDSDLSLCYDTEFQCSVGGFVAQAVALFVLVLSLSLAVYVYVRSRVTGRKLSKEEALKIDAEMEDMGVGMKQQAGPMALEIATAEPTLRPDDRPAADPAPNPASDINLSAAIATVGGRQPNVKSDGTVVNPYFRTDLPQVHAGAQLGSSGGAARNRSATSPIGSVSRSTGRSQSGSVGRTSSRGGTVRSHGSSVSRSTGRGGRGSGVSHVTGRSHGSSVGRSTSRSGSGSISRGSGRGGSRPPRSNSSVGPRSVQNNRGRSNNSRGGRGGASSVRSNSRGRAYL